MKTYVQYPPCKMQGEGYAGPITLSQYERFQHVRESPGKRGNQDSAAEWKLTQLIEIGPGIFRGRFFDRQGNRAQRVGFAILNDVNPFSQRICRRYGFPLRPGGFRESRQRFRGKGLMVRR